MKVVAYADGASRGNPGLSSFGAVVFDTDGNTLREVSQAIGRGTNNVAEYRGAIAAILADAKLEPPADQRPILGGRRGHHSEHLGHLLSELQSLQRTFPGAVW